MEHLDQRSDEQVLDEQERAATVQLLRTIVSIVLLASLIVLVADGILGGEIATIVAMLPLSLLMVFSLRSLNRGVLWHAQVLIPTSVYIALTYLIIIGSGMHDVAIFAYSAVLLLSGLTLRRYGPLIFGALTVLSIVIIGGLEVEGVIVNQGSSLTGWDDIVLLGIFIVTTTVLQRLTLGRLNEGLARARRNEQAQMRANRELRWLQASLEGRVEERTQELARRTHYLEVTAEVSRATSATLDLENLLPQVVHLVSDQFGFYHTGIFLLDDLREWAELRAASSEGGQRMLARSHRLRVEDRGIVGYAANQGEARIALDTDADRVFLENPDLPDTRSEMALPLRARGEVIGVLDVQSTAPQAFSMDDVNMLQVLADQIALAINNAQLFQQAQEGFEIERRAYGEMSVQAWEQLVQRRAGLGYRSRLGVVTSVSSASAMEAGALPTLEVPVRVRGQVVATIQARKPEEGPGWSEDESALVAALGEQLSTALESARLYQDTQRRAAREGTIREIADDMQRATDMQSLLRITAEALNRALRSSRVYVRMETAEPQRAGEEL